MKFNYHNYPDGIHEIELSGKAKELGLDNRFGEDLYIVCTMDKSSRQIVLKCDVSFELNLECDRCNSNFNENVEVDFKVIRVFDRENYDPSDANTAYLSPEIIEIDLSNDVKDFVMLSLPMKKLCSDDCKGLCSGCGANLNESECKCSNDETNPVWNELLKLKDKLNKI